MKFMSMLSSVFSRRRAKGVQRKLSDFARIRRTHSPPSPGSFQSPEISERPFNPYTQYNPSSSEQSVNATNLQPPLSNGSQSDSSIRASSPRVQLDFSMQDLSDWFPSELLQARSDSPVRRPERNVSLGVVAATGISGTSQAGSSQARSSLTVASGSGNTVAGSSTLRVMKTRQEHSEDMDDVIVIEASRGRDSSLSPIGSNFVETSREIGTQSTSRSPSPPGQGRRPAPSPIKIPDNSSGSKIRAENPDLPTPQSSKRSPKPKTTGASNLASPSRPVSRTSSRRKSGRQSLPRTKSSKRTSARKSTHPSLTRTKSRPQSRSRPSSMYSRYSDTDGDLDDSLSAISGTTIARALVSSYVFSSSSPSAWNSPSSNSYSRSRGHLARQDSATLPKSDFPYLSNRKSVRSSRGSISSNAAPASSTYWRDRKISGDHIVVLSPEERERESWGVEPPPVPPMPEGLSPDPSARSSQASAPSTRSRRESPNIASGTLAPVSNVERLSTGGSISSRRATKELTLDPDPERKRQRLSKMSNFDLSTAALLSDLTPSTSSSAPTPSAHSTQPTTIAASDFDDVSSGKGGRRTSSQNSPDLDNDKELENGVQELVYTRSPPTKHTSSPDAPTTATSASLSVYSDDHARSISMYSGTQSPGSTAILSPGLTSIISFSPVSAGSVRTPGSSSSVGSRDPALRSFSEARLRRNDSPSKPLVSMLPIAERPRSAQVPHSPSSPNTSPENTRPQSMLTSPHGSAIDSPDLLDIMFAGSRPPLARSSSSGAAVRLGSPPAPISLPLRSTPVTPSLDSRDEQVSPQVQQKFPETPYAFTPLVSAGFMTPKDVPPLPKRTGTFSGRGVRGPRTSVTLGRSALVRSASLTSPPSTASRAYAWTSSTTISSGRPASLGENGERNKWADSNDSQDIPSGLTAIEETSAPSTPIDDQSLHASTLALSRIPASAGVNSSLLQPTTPPSRAPSPYAASIPLPPSPMSPLSPLKRKHSSIDPKSASPSPLVQSDWIPGSPRPSPSPLSLDFPHRQISEDAVQPQQRERRPTFSTVGQTRAPRTRPPPPSGPRRPSTVGSNPLINRNRAPSVSSPASSPQGLAGTAMSHQPSVGATAHSPRFQTHPIQFRGLTLDVARWTFTSDELQGLVSTAIRQSSDASAIRLLPVQTLQDTVPAEIQRLEALNSDLKTRYKLGMRKRAKLLGSLLSIADGSELSDHTGSLRHLEELSSLSESLDDIAEELYQVTDQLAQLAHVRDLHSSSALAMALRKLNSAFVKQMAENQSLRQQLTALEDERNEAWMHAQDAAEELDALNDKVAISEGVITPASSRRSSCVLIARKTSLRNSDHRTSISSRLRSQRSSVATTRSSMALSPTAKLTPSEKIPPVPPIPIRTPLGILTSGLPTRSSGMGSSVTPNSEIRAMMRAQEELYEILGLKADELREQRSAGRQRSQSTSAVSSRSQDSKAPTRRNSEVLSPCARKSEAWHHHFRSRSIDDRTAVLATIGISLP